MTADVLRGAVAVLAMLVVGSALVLAGRYLLAAYRLGRAPGRILARHVVEVALGTSGLALGYGIAVAVPLGGIELISATGRLWLYLVSMLLLLTGIAEVSSYQRTRARRYPVRQAQVREAIRAALEGHPVTGPKSADYAAVLSANAVLDLEGTPPMPPPDAPRREGPVSTISPAEYGRHARRRSP